MIKLSTLANVIRNKRSPGADMLESILLNNPDLNADWLLTEKGDMLKSQTDSINTEMKRMIEKYEKMTKELKEEAEYHKRVNVRILDMIDKAEKK